MKKPGFIVAETFLSLVLVASLAAVAALAIDIKTDGKLIPPELYGGKSQSSQASQQSSVESKDESSQSEQQSSSEEKQESKQESKQENKQESKAEASKAEKPKQQSSASSEKPEQTNDNALKLILEAPENLSTQPQELEEFLDRYGIGFDQVSFDHVIVVDHEDSTAKVYCYQKNYDGYWWNIAGDGKPITDKAFIGEEGTGYDLSPESKKTPLGIYHLGDGFYIGDKPKTNYPMFEITKNTYWVDDPASAFYNTKVEGTDRKDWSSADHMISEKDAYKYGIVIDYNTDNIDHSLGNSIFMSCGNAPSEGSIVVPQNVMKAILEWLDEDGINYIYIVP